MKDFLYIDSDRVRSYLAQLSGGIVEKVVNRTQDSEESRAGASLFKLVNFGGSLETVQASEQTKTMRDALYMLFEEAAEEQGLLRTVSELSDTAAWRDGDVHRTLKEGQIIRVTAETVVIDPLLFKLRVEQLAKWPEFIVRFAHQTKLKELGEGQRKRLSKELKRGVVDDTTIDLLMQFAEFFDMFAGGQITIRQFPAGTSHSQFSLGGVLSARPGYLQESREILYGKYGAKPMAWTIVSQVARIPDQEHPGQVPVIGDLQGLTPTGAVNRVQVEELAMYLLRVAESFGFSESPTYPAISITPLAVYRSHDN